MKKSILFGMEETYPQAFIDRVNSKNEKEFLLRPFPLTKLFKIKTENMQ
jgi:hypothetical protein